MTASLYSDLERPPLREAALRRALLVPGGLWTSLRVVAQTGSTNVDLAAAARTGAPEGTVLVAERQVTGRGRLGRQWESPARAGIAVSVLLRPGAPGAPGTPVAGLPPVAPVRYGWLSLLAGVAVVQAVRRVAGVDAALKWPNDLLVAERKCGGILAEAVTGQPDGAAIALGVGLNVTLRPDELPFPMATSLAVEGAACVDRDPLLRALLRDFADRYLAWRAVGGDPDACGLREAYQEHCATVGSAVRVALPGERSLTGAAVGIDPDGRLLVRGEDGTRHALAAGDVVHVRRAGEAASSASRSGC